MLRFDLMGAIEQRPNGAYVKFDDVIELCKQTEEYVEVLTSQIKQGNLKECDAIKALQVHFRLALS